LLALTACNLFTVDEPPGVGEKAEIGYAALAPIIKALEQHRTDTGTYPASLDELVPDYLSEIPTEVNDQPIYYKIVEGSFTLSFHYVGPGMNTCTYTPEDKWHCSGAY
jgi:hypothetical protein